MRGDSRASEYTRRLAREIYCSEITRVRQRPLLFLFLSFFLGLSGRRSSGFAPRFLLRFFRLSAISSTRSSSPARLVSAVFFSLNTFFFSRHILSKNERPKINPRLIVTCQGLRILSFICATRFLEWRVFTLLSRDIDQSINPCSWCRSVISPLFLLFLLYFYFFIFECYLFFYEILRFINKRFTCRKIYWLI